MHLNHTGRRSVRSALAVGGALIAAALAVGGALIAAAALACTAQAAGPFDGTYTGPAVLLSGNNGSFCKTFSSSITVTDGHLTYVHGSGYAVIHADIAADGSFSGSGELRGYKVPATETLTGKASGSVIEADAAGPYCKFHLTLHKQP